MRRTVAFVVNDEPGGALARRAESLADRLRPDSSIIVLCRGRRKVLAILRFIVNLADARPEIVYVFDMGYSGVLAGVFYKLVSRRPLIIETGDVISALARSLGRTAVGLWLTERLESLAFAVADRIVVRSTTFQDVLKERGVENVVVIPDGVDTQIFTPRQAGCLRADLGLNDALVVGVVGTCRWSPTLNWCYGMELVEAMRWLIGEPVKGLIVGDGDGLPLLKKRARELGVADRLVFVGRVPYEELPEYINAMDVCLSTQTNDLVGHVRTTGKLPLYLACGRFVLATRVGEAARVLPEGMLVPCQGVIDPDYPRRLAERIRELLHQRELLAEGMRLRQIAREMFDYDLLARQLKALLVEVVRTKHGE
ncbi:MAG TPA: glycosyltransferase [Blastocatellia bacterium]|nr:glycosyltransferase [Blastocatellia bacterium]